MVAASLLVKPPCLASDDAAPLAAGMARERDAKVFGFTIHYREAGEGPVAILLHGLGGDGSRWTATMDALAGEFRTIAPDQIGFGQSDKPLADYNHAMLGEFLAEFMKQLGIEKASLVGHSMGAFVAMRVAVHHPELVDRLVLVDGGSLATPPRRGHLVQIQNGTTLAEIREYFELMFYDKSRVTEQMVRDNYERRLRVAYTISKMQQARATGHAATVTKEQARGIRAPTLILWGKHDRLLDPADAAALERAIPNARAVLIEKCGHIPQVEQPERFHQLLRDFLAGGAAGRPAGG
jgi:pimeloyl-ACP methyl ester carboxylesterase